MSSLIQRPATFREGPRRLQARQLDDVQRAFVQCGLAGVCRDFGYATDLDALRAIAQALSLPVIDLSREQPSRDLLQDFPVRLIHRHGIFPVSRTEQTLRIVLSNPFDVQAADAVAEATGLFVTVCTALPTEVGGLIKLHLG
ncbi:MAG: hypothetical protein ACK5A3_06560, partial [Planctomyces sp.]